MLIRFLDGKETCYQVDTHKTPILIYLESQDELEYVSKIKLGGCLISVPKDCDEETSKRFCDKLNTKEEPRNLK